MLFLRGEFLPRPGARAVHRVKDASCGGWDLEVLVGKRRA